MNFDASHRVGVLHVAAFQPATPTDVRKVFDPSDSAFLRFWASPSSGAQAPINSFLIVGGAKPPPHIKGQAQNYLVAVRAFDHAPALSSWV